MNPSTIVALIEQAITLIQYSDQRDAGVALLHIVINDLKAAPARGKTK